MHQHVLIVVRVIHVAEGITANILIVLIQVVVHAVSLLVTWSLAVVVGVVVVGTTLIVLLIVGLSVLFMLG